MLTIVRALLGVLGTAALTAGAPRVCSAAKPPALGPPVAVDSVLVLRGRVFDGTGRPALEHGVVVIRDGRVVAVGPAGKVQVPGAARVIEVATGTILPGLIDLHQHLRPQYAAWLLPAGITTVRDANNTLDVLQQARAIRPFAPRILYSGPLLDGPDTFFRSLLGAYGTPDSVLTTLVRPATAGPIREVMVLQAATPEQARAAVDSLAAHGATVVKLYEQLAWPVYQAAAAQARRRRLPVMTDLGMETTRGLSKAQVDARQAMQAGVGSIEHASGYALAYQRLGGDPTREPFDDRLLDQLARETVRRRVALVPTLSAFYAGIAPDSSRRIAALPGGDRVPPPMVQFFEQQLQGFRRETVHKASLADFHLAQALTRRIQQLGGLIGAGTDAPAGAYNLPGGGLHRELALLVEAGLTPAQALYAATGGAARILRQPTLGTLQPGQVADVLVVEGNPTQDIRATRAIRHVIQQGRVLPLTELIKQATTEEGSLPD
ncbi:amidohydrolase family protein [Hymenobacter sp. NST-14]|uniref:amidohydrolase family protein n=1 Tax=Hymenobacter piscis TaxID=2839984 RepID=UPI001C0145D4|nr:amidohydrolase family protein [Hymenobacter piscis]MBT9391703.1 amidohydrolase family protein [Hymenobacter piscis]